jgi:hypothetical protein
MHCAAGSPNISCNSKVTSCAECTSYIGTAYQDLYLNTTAKQALDTNVYNVKYVQCKCVQYLGLISTFAYLYIRVCIRQLGHTFNLEMKLKQTG